MRVDLRDMDFLYLMVGDLALESLHIVEEVIAANGSWDPHRR